MDTTTAILEQLFTYFGVINVKTREDTNDSDQSCKVTIIDINNNLLNLHFWCRLVGRLVDAFNCTQNYAHFLLRNCVDNGDDDNDDQNDDDDDYAYLLAIRHDGLRLSLIKVNCSNESLSIHDVDKCNWLTYKMQRSVENGNATRDHKIPHELAHCIDLEKNFVASFACKGQKNRNKNSNKYKLCATNTCCFLAHNSRTCTPRMFRVFREPEPLWQIERLQFKQGKTSNIDEAVSSRIQVRDLCAGYDHVLLLDTLGRVHSFGTGSRGELGHGTIRDERSPRVIDALRTLRVTQIACGAWHSMALDEDGDVYGWGWNSTGQLGDCCAPGAIIDVPLPVAHNFGGEPVVRIAAHRNGTVFWYSDGRFVVLGELGYQLHSRDGNPECMKE